MSPIFAATKLELTLCQSHFTNVELYQPISSRVDEESASEAVDASSITGPVKLNTLVLYQLVFTTFLIEVR